MVRPSIHTGQVHFDKYQIDRTRWQLTWCDQPVSLNKRTFDLLVYLVDHRERVVGKEELLQALWPEQFIEESNLTQHIFLLRKALSRHLPETRIIETVSGRGYRFAIPVAEDMNVPEQMPEEVSEQLTIAATESTTRIHIEEVEESTESPASANRLWTVPLGRPQRALLAVGSIVMVVALAAAGWFAWQRWLDHTGGAPVQVVMLPFEGTTGDPVLDKSLTQALRMDLAQSPYVTVVSSSMVGATLVQMLHKPDDPITQATAREVCERTNSQGVLSGNIARVGQHFLITEETSNCVDGSVVAATKYEASKVEDLPRAIDQIAAELRQKLGESRRSIARFNTPLSHDNTGSLEALKDYSQALHLAQAGKFTDAIALASQAVALDPNFAAAWLQLSVLSGNVDDSAHQREYIAKAYALREQVDQPTRLSITAMYNQSVTGDLYQSLANLQTWTTLYPRNPVPWSGLLQAYRELGRHTEAVEAGQHALQLNPRSLTYHYGVALEQLHSGAPGAAKATCELALSRGLDGDNLRGVLFRVAVLVGDDNLRMQQESWTEAHPNATFMLTSEASLAIAQGRFADARHLMDRAAEAYRRQGMAGQADAIWRQSATDWGTVGDHEDALLAMQHGTLDSDEPFEFFDVAAIGDYAKADALMQAEIARHPQDTLANRVLAPWLRAQMALQANRPAAAVAELDRIAPLDHIFLETTFDRGRALLQNDQLPEAAAAYRELIAHPFADVLSPSISVSWLYLGRTLARQDKTAEAADAYGHFLALWANADPDAHDLKQAREELAKLQASAKPGPSHSN